MSNNKEVRSKLEELQLLVVEALIEELKSGDTTNISVANTLLTANKVITQPDSEESMHSKVQRIMDKNK